MGFIPWVATSIRGSSRPLGASGSISMVYSVPGGPPREVASTRIVTS